MKAEIPAFFHFLLFLEIEEKKKIWKQSHPSEALITTKIT
jgi:hypothetical protein